MQLRKELTLLLSNGKFARNAEKHYDVFFSYCQSYHSSKTHPLSIFKYLLTLFLSRAELNFRNRENISFQLPSSTYLQRLSLIR